MNDLFHLGPSFRDLFDRVASRNRDLNCKVDMRGKTPTSTGSTSTVKEYCASALTPALIAPVPAKEAHICEPSKPPDLKIGASPPSISLASAARPPLMSAVIPILIGTATPILRILNLPKP
ncbi:MULTISPECIES: hypothetical protein [unclassified Paraburkholderia]|uniref:hypothetical protein n=1 Tax=unclassified Paraburkholderia TaxID=2615204 RepID=UPI0016095C7F|nr:MULTISPECIES: hypothetical protein [unclassified Paraburkholderia]MBB5407655.1 hypothetical protein [Paraburkholderia sp. HC6.4b]MBB5452332.1 hypothetical protein [Paraburkholderia sp. Kb1A]